MYSACQSASGLFRVAMRNLRHAVTESGDEEELDAVNEMSSARCWAGSDFVGGRSSEVIYIRTLWLVPVPAWIRAANGS